jgi:hypothetical protein
MSLRLSLTSRGALVGLTVLAAACDRSAPAIVTPAQSGHDHGQTAVAAPIDAAAEAGLKALKRATAPFQDFAVAQDSGFTTKVTACFESLPLGAMGSHYGDASTFDATLNPTRPEVLLYERLPGGTLQLVGVEFIVPFSAWTDVNPPTLFGQTFVRNTTFNVWALHAWVWKSNPRGVFSDWNPTVHC